MPDGSEIKTTLDYGAHVVIALGAKHRKAVAGNAKHRKAFDALDRSVSKENRAAWTAAEKKALEHRNWDVSAMDIFEVNIEKGEGPRNLIPEGFTDIAQLRGGTTCSRR